MDNIRTKDLMKKLNNLFELNLEIPRIKVGKKQTVETLINEEALSFAKYLRNETKKWNPRLIVVH